MNKRPQAGGSSPLKGAWFDSSGRYKKKWGSSIRINGKLVFLGRFSTDAEAAAAYAEAAKKHHGEFARTSEGIDH